MCSSDLDTAVHKKPQALITKELRVLLRTMTYRMNCIYVNLLWLVAAPVLGLMAAEGGALNLFAKELQAGDALCCTLMFSAVVASSFVASGLNSLASTSFTREGTHIDLIKYIPVDIKTQIKAKAFVSILITFIPLAIAIIVLTLFFGIPLMMLLYIPTAFLCCVIACMTGMLMDSIAPYTIWSDELSALRGNLNCFFNLAAMLLVAAVLAAMSYGLYVLTGSFVAAAGINLIILILAALWGIFKGLDKVRNNIESLT